MKKKLAGQGELWSVKADHVWQRRFYDFNVWSARKRAEKLAYIHDNPVNERLVLEPDQWEWSSYRNYVYGEAGRVRINVMPELKSVAAA